ncbi:threonine/homoserine/homoserine lactone efflux protein [Rhizobium sp. SG_E_25_P2]|uniref:LysE family translocator n=1 Tax=Rhizobium sp. SG_E_25_P2 TaxID=2879942 RepID=UPI002475294A|nr:LysE family translocator [Rhizobium sp. SG_E_25_P2]MDH6268417.1 threonine/homoserine/homoserine lactone efflux protein [Rhizobium sp. SG_E_25_P2]
MSFQELRLLPDLPHGLLPFLLASLLIELTPGPNMTWLAILTLAEGRARGLMAVAGVGLGLALLGALGALGVSEIVQSSRLAYEILRWAGAAFLVYLAWEGWRGGEREDGGGERRAFARGFIANLLNPKAAVFYIAVLPGFITPDHAVAAQTWTLTAAYVVVATSVHAGIVLLAATLAPLLMQPRRAEIARKILSVGLFGVAVWFILTSSRA